MGKSDLLRSEERRPFWEMKKVRMMRRQKAVVLLVLALFCGICIMVCCQYEQGIEHLLFMEVEADQGLEEISLWQREEGTVYAFLPGYSQMKNVRIRTKGSIDAKIQGEVLQDGMTCEAFQIDTPYEIEYVSWGGKQREELVFIQSSKVATMYIDTESGNMNYVHGSKGNQEKGDIRVYRADGEMEFEGELKSVGGRGNTTWDDAEKKPYNIELNRETNLLEMGMAAKWILLANSKDPSNMRNKIVYDFADEIGLAYSPATEWVDLYLNGEYAGLYLLSERNEVHPERIAIEHPDSLLVSLERRGRMVTQNLPTIQTSEGQVLRIRYPKEQTVEQKETFTNEWQTVEDAILAGDGIDRKTGKSWMELIDLDSWARKYLVEEIFGNLDGCWISQYFYYNGNEEERRIYAGPVWDFDLSMGRTWQTADVNFMIANRLHVSDEYDTPWFHALYKKEEFQQHMEEIYKEEFLPKLRELCVNKIKEYDILISDAARMNAVRWGGESYTEDIDRIKTYLERRVSFLSELWLEDKEYYMVEAHNEGASYAYFAVEDGAQIKTLPVFEDSATQTFVGWVDENGEAFDGSKAICEDIRIYAKWSGVPSFVFLYGEYFMPLAVIALLGVIILAADVRRMRKGG